MANPKNAISPEEVYQNFLNIYILSNPKPIRGQFTDRMIDFALPVVIFGAIFLSGTRTGTSVAMTQTFSHLLTGLELSNRTIIILSLVEGISAFLTIEAALVVGGYLLGHNDNNPIWYRVFLGAAIATAFVSNLTPAANLWSGSEVNNTWLVLVNVVVGISTLILAVIGGRVLAVYRNRRKTEYQSVIEEWEERAKKAWQRSPQYRQLRSTTDTTNPNGYAGVSAEEIYAHVKSVGSATYDQLAAQFNISLKEVNKLGKDLIGQGKIKMVGNLLKSV